MKVIPKSLGLLQMEGAIMEVMNVQGISEEWTVFIPVEAKEKTIFVLHGPTSGSWKWLDEWASTPQDATEFPFVNHEESFCDALEQAMQFVVSASLEAVRNEVLN